MRVIVILSIFFLLVLVLFLLVQLRGISSIQSNNAPEKGPSARKTNSPPAAAPGGFYLGKGDQQVYVDYATPNPVLRSFMQSVMENGSGRNTKGREIFTKICAACHQPDGEGKEGVAPPLVGSEWVLTPDGGRLARIALNGLKGPVRVRGREWNLVMPPWRENLDDDQLAVTLTFVRSQLGTNHAGTLTPEFIAAARQNTAAATETETAEGLKRISDGE